MKYLLRILLLLLPSYNVLADPVTCSHHNDYGHPENCRIYPGCQVVTYTDGYLCATNCLADPLQNNEDTCNNYAGCKWNSDTNVCEPFVRNHYRAWDSTNNQFIEAECPPEYPLSQPGTDDEEFCYKPCASGSDNTNSTCGFYKSEWFNGVVSCLQPNTNTLVFSNDYHLEGSDGCYLNTRPCNKFSITIAQTNSKPSHNGEPYVNNISGNAIWSDDGFYNIDACKYVFESTDESAHCTVSVSLSTIDSSIQGANTSITYTSNSNFSFYHCKSCNNGYIPTADKPNGYMSCKNDLGTKACQCIQSQPGFYTTCTWNFPQALDACGPNKCPAGKTSPAGSSDAEDCHFGGETKLCDDAGCISLDGLGGVSAQNWEYVQ